MALLLTLSVAAVHVVRGGGCVRPRPPRPAPPPHQVPPLQSGGAAGQGQGARGHQDHQGQVCILISAANRLIGEVVQSRRRPLLGPSPG